MLSFTRLLASAVMTSGDVCDQISGCLSCLVHVLATTWCVSVMMLFRSEGGALDDKTGGLCHESERRLGMRRSSQRRSHWNAGFQGLGVMTRRSIDLAVDVGNLLQELCLCECRHVRLPPAHVWRRSKAATVRRPQNALASVFTL
jgi:hypothetical protein